MRIVVRRRGKKMCYRHWWYFDTCDTGEMPPCWQAAIEIHNNWVDSMAENLRTEIDAEVLAQISKESK